MKLVNILARILKVWPKYATHAVQDHTGVYAAEIYLLTGPKENTRPANAHGGWYLGDGVCAVGQNITGCELAEDCATSIVTQEQWQAAVDALKVEPWNGEGLPPVGTVCVLSGTTPDLTTLHPEWEGAEVKVYAHFTTDQDRALAAYVSADHMKGGVGIAELFLPIRTAEQIAADERLHKVRNALSTIKASRLFPSDEAQQNVMVATVEAMIDAGFVQQVAQ